MAVRYKQVWTCPWSPVANSSPWGFINLRLTDLLLARCLTECFSYVKVLRAHTACGRSGNYLCLIWAVMLAKETVSKHQIKNHGGKTCAAATFLTCLYIYPWQLLKFDWYCVWFWSKYSSAIWALILNLDLSTIKSPKILILEFGI